jgi:acyl carrier protein
VSDDLEEVTQIVRDLFDEYDGPVTRTLSARDVAQWDSLANVQFVVLIEQALGVRFNTDEIGTFHNLGDLLDAVAKKRAMKS